MSKYIDAKRLYEDITFEQVKLLYKDHIWKKIPGVLVDAYASNLGLIFRDYRSYYQDKAKHTIKSVLFDCNNNEEVYTRVGLRGGKTNKAHRYIISAFYGASNLEVNHKDFNKGNNNIDNLEYMTRRENAIHAVNGGRFPKHLNLSDEERHRRSLWAKEHCRRQKLGLAKHGYGVKIWTDEDRKIYSERAKKAKRDSLGRFVKGDDA